MKKFILKSLLALYSIFAITTFADNAEVKHLVKSDWFDERGGDKEFFQNNVLPNLVNEDISAILGKYIENGFEYNGKKYYIQAVVSNTIPPIVQMYKIFWKDPEFADPIAISEYTENQEITPYIPVEKAGYTFVGWDPALPERMPAHNLVETAIYISDNSAITTIETLDGRTHEITEKISNDIINTYGITNITKLSLGDNAADFYFYFERFYSLKELNINTKKRIMMSGLNIFNIDNINIIPSNYFGYEYKNGILFNNNRILGINIDQYCTNNILTIPYISNKNICELGWITDKGVQLIKEKQVKAIIFDEGYTSINFDIWDNSVSKNITLHYPSTLIKLGSKSYTYATNIFMTTSYDIITTNLIEMYSIATVNEKFLTPNLPNIVNHNNSYIDINNKFVIINFNDNFDINDIPNNINNRDIYFNGDVNHNIFSKINTNYTNNIIKLKNINLSNSNIVNFDKNIQSLNSWSHKGLTFAHLLFNLNNSNANNIPIANWNKGFYNNYENYPYRALTACNKLILDNKDLSNFAFGDSMGNAYSYHAGTMDLYFNIDTCIYPNSWIFMNARPIKNIYIYSLDINKLKQLLESKTLTYFNSNFKINMYLPKDIISADDENIIRQIISNNSEITDIKNIIFENLSNYWDITGNNFNFQYY